MKKIIIASALTLLSGTVLAQGFINGPNNMTPKPLNTVKEVLVTTSAQDDIPVVLTGNILQPQGKDYYLFKDLTGTVTVEIDSDKWSGQVVSPTTNVQLMGEVEHRMNGIRVDVDSVRVL